MEWVQFAMFVLSIAISLANQKKAPAPPKAEIDEFDFPQTDEGTPRAVYFGECWSTSWCVIGLGNFRQISIFMPGGVIDQLRRHRDLVETQEP